MSCYIDLEPRREVFCRNDLDMSLKLMTSLFFRQPDQRGVQQDEARAGGRVPRHVQEDGSDARDLPHQIGHSSSFQVGLCLEHVLP